MENKLSIVKNGLQEILKKKYEERDAQMAMELINQYERALANIERMRPTIERLENGEDVQSVVSEYYNQSNQKETKVAVDILERPEAYY